MQYENVGLQRVKGLTKKYSLHAKEDFLCPFTR